ncbi:hypothetical protein Tco_1048034, partial [Tanacetum coccineum]
MPGSGEAIFSLKYQSSGRQQGLTENRYMGRDRGGEEATSAISCAFIELKTCNVALLEAADESWEE